MRRDDFQILNLIFSVLLQININIYGRNIIVATVNTYNVLFSNK